MTPARARNAQPHPRRAAPPPRPRVIAGGARGIRWDRVGRVALLVVLVGLVYLYIGPAVSFVETVGESKSRGAEVEKLRQENLALRERRKALRDPRTLESEARKLGMVKPGERGYILKGLPR